MKGENIRKVAERNHLTKAVYVGDIQGDYDASMQAGVEFIHAGCKCAGDCSFCGIAGSCEVGTVGDRMKLLYM